MPGCEITLAFFATALLLALAPGPDNIFVLTQSTLYGALAGIATTFGLITGLCAHTLAVAIGIAALLRASPLAFGLIKMAGAVYLCWLAFLCLKAGAAHTKNGCPPFPGYLALYRRGIIMNVTNPKVALFFLAFLPQFCIPEAGAYAWQITWFGLWFMLATLIVFGIIALLGGRLAGWFNHSPGKQIFLHRLTALIFIILAIVLLFSRLETA